MPARPTLRLVVALSMLGVAHASAEAAERERFHAWFLAGPTHLLAANPIVATPANVFLLPAGEPERTIPQFQAGIALAATPRVSVSFDVRRFEAEQSHAGPEGVPVRRSVLAWGPGVRRTVGDGSLRPFLQANFLLITEEFDDAFVDESDVGVGLGLLVGADVHLTEALSIPVAGSLLLGQAIHDVSAVGIVAGLSVHPATGWSADPRTRAIEVVERRDTIVEAADDPRSRIELGFGRGDSQHFDTERGEGPFPAGHALYLQTLKPGLGVSFESRVYRDRTDEGTSGWFYGDEVRTTHTVVLAGPGIRFTRTAGWARRFFQASLGVAADTRSTASGTYESRTRDVGPALGLAVGLDVRLSSRLTLPLAARYDHLFQRDDYSLTALEGGLAIAFGRAVNGS